MEKYVSNIKEEKNMLTFNTLLPIARTDLNIKHTYRHHTDFENNRYNKQFYPTRRAIVCSVAYLFRRTRLGVPTL